MKRIFIGLFLLLNVVGCASHEVIETMTDHANQDEDLSLLSPKRIVNIAHRGASGHAPEHTLVSYETSEEMTGDYLEIDLQMTKDNQLIAMHDAELSRTTDGDGFRSEERRVGKSVDLGVGRMMRKREINGKEEDEE